MKGIQVAKVGGTFEYVENLEKPKPGKNQILVKSLVTAINPVYALLLQPKMATDSNSGKGSCNPRAN